MDSVFVDSDIVLDLFLNREPFCYYAAELFTLADGGKLKVYMSSLSFTNIDYLLSKQHGKAGSRGVLRKLKILVTVLPVDDKTLTLALESPFTDFEDAIQYFTARENGVNVLITRNLKDYKHAEMPIMTAQAFIKK
ncbi:MAG: PIN domain-containing protein [Taibaiella sp.]|nr:PIN domain-containing protein [Taibaiella sp.]